MTRTEIITIAALAFALAILAAIPAAVMLGRRKDRTNRLPSQPDFDAAKVGEGFYISSKNRKQKLPEEPC